MKNQKRTRVAEGIYQDQYGYLATVTLRGRRRDQRFPLGTAIPFMVSWRIQVRAELDAEKDQAPADDDPPERGTWNADVQRYLPLIAGRESYKADRSHLMAWAPHIGTSNRTVIKPAHVMTAIGKWLEAGISSRTIRHRVRVLRNLYRTLDGKQAKPPLQDVTVPAPADPNPTPVSLEMIQRVAASLKRGITRQKACGPNRTVVEVQCAEPAKCHARFLVRATTGQRPAQIMRAQPEDLDLVRRIWFVRAAKGGRTIPLPLHPEMVKAWRAFIAADAWGDFDTRSFAKTLRRHGWPEGVRPYALRHTFAIDHLLGGTDIGDLQGLLGHRQLETTRKFYGPVLVARLRKAGANRRLKLA